MRDYNSIEEMKKARWDKWRYFSIKARQALNDKLSLEFLPDYLSRSENRNVNLWIYRILTEFENPAHQFWIDACWQNISTRNINTSYNLPFTQDHGDYLLLLLDEKDWVFAYAFLNDRDTTRLNARLPRATSIAGLTDDIEFFTYDILGDPE